MAVAGDIYAGFVYAALGALVGTGVALFEGRSADADWILLLLTWIGTGVLGGLLVGFGMGFAFSEPEAISVVSRAVRDAEEAATPLGDKLIMLAIAVVTIFVVVGFVSIRSTHSDATLSWYWAGMGVGYACAVTVPAFLFALAYPIFQWIARRQFVTLHVIYLFSAVCLIGVIYIQEGSKALAIVARSVPQAPTPQQRINRSYEQDAFCCHHD